MKRKYRRLSPSTRAKISEAMKGSKNPMWGKFHLEATKQKISESMIEYWRQIKKYPDNIDDR